MFFPVARMIKIIPIIVKRSLKKYKPFPMCEIHKITGWYMDTT